MVNKLTITFSLIQFSEMLFFYFHTYKLLHSLKKIPNTRISYLISFEYCFIFNRAFLFRRLF